MKKTILILVCIFCITGCFFDPYKNERDAEVAVDSWFNYKNEEDNLGDSRKKIENINEIKNVKCTYQENDINKNYVYLCTIEYSPLGETIIPLSKNETISVYVVLSYNDDRTYNYIVYNSLYTDSPWLYDDTINYEKE